MLEELIGKQLGNNTGTRKTYLGIRHRFFYYYSTHEYTTTIHYVYYLKKFLNGGWAKCPLCERVCIQLVNLDQAFPDQIRLG